MMSPRALSVFVVTLLAGCGSSSPEEQFIQDAAAALGGRDRVLAVQTLISEGEGRHFNLGQDMRPGASEQTFAVTALKRQVDLAGRRSRTELTRTPDFLYWQGLAPQRQVEGIDGKIAYNLAANGNAVGTTASVAAERQAEFFHHPVVIVAAALAPGARVANVRSEGTERRADITTEDGVQLALVTDGSGLPTRVESRRYHPNLGDVIISTHFSDFREIDGLRVPTHVATKTDDFTTADLRLTNNVVNATTDDLAAPAAVASAAPRVPAATKVVEQEVAPGIWLLAGESHHSALVELSDRLLLIEAPRSEARTLAVIARARELRPQKPLSDLIVTHHHFDHTAGLRAAIAEGLRIVTHDGNRGFVEEMARRPHTMVADVLAKSTQPLEIETLADELVIKDAMRTVALYHVRGNPHSDTLLMLHLPGERVVIEADAFSPGDATHPYALNLLDEITRRGLQVERIVPLHGAVVPFSELEQLRDAETK